MFLDFNHSTEIITKLNSLNPTTQPKWGIMTPQHMVEHLIVITKISNGGLNIPCRIPKDQIAGYRAFLLESDKRCNKELKLVEWMVCWIYVTLT